MVELCRTVRANLGGAHPADLPHGSNGHAGQPPMSGLGAYYEFHVTCAGEPDPVSGYLINIKLIDQAVRRTVLPRVHHQLRSDPAADPVALLPELARRLSSELTATLRALRWNLSPHLSLEHRMSEPSAALLRQRFEFAAAHRLHVPELSEAENRATFGKCNNPSGHGHNYEVEVCVAVPVDGRAMHAAELERLVDETVIQRFDHKHLNLDTAEFGPGGVNPSVENIARVAFDLLAPAMKSARGAGTLRGVTVWETPKTSATYPAR